MVFSSEHMLYAYDNEGLSLPNFSMPFDDTYTAPILADIDEDDDIEIIIAELGVLRAFNYDGSECIGWRLEASNGSPFNGSPFIGDIDADGLNEVVISSQSYETYVWDTTGDADKVEWGSYRSDEQNTAVYRKECMFSSLQSVEVTGSNELWDVDRHIQGDLVVKAGAFLKITSEVTFTSGGTFIIEPGGKVSLEGGVLTNKCGGLWKGIRVNGNKGMTQTSANQGILITKGGAIIEHAEIAVYVANDPDTHDNDSGAGGIVKIKISTFRDNIIGVEMPSYFQENSSFIRNSTFETSNYLSGRETYPVAFIAAWDVGYIDINDNIFINHLAMDPNDDPLNFYQQGKGVTCFNSKLNIFNNSFDNLYSSVETQGFVSSF